MVIVIDAGITVVEIAFELFIRRSLESIEQAYRDTLGMRIADAAFCDKITDGDNIHMLSGAVLLKIVLVHHRCIDEKLLGDVIFSFKFHAIVGDRIQIRIPPCD